MPTKVSTWACKLCNKYWDEEGHAKICEESHVQLDALHVIDFEKLPNKNTAFQPGMEFPNTIIVGDKYGKKAVYVLPSSGKTAELSRPTRVGAVKLHHKE